MIVKVVDKLENSFLVEFIDIFVIFYVSVVKVFIDVGFVVGEIGVLIDKFSDRKEISGE